jgi:hypothetical protein
MNSNENLKRLGSNPGAVVNTDNNSLRAYREAREKLRIRDRDFDQMKNDVFELKSMMAQILEKLNK